LLARVSNEDGEVHQLDITGLSPAAISRDPDPWARTRSRTSPCLPLDVRHNTPRSATGAGQEDTPMGIKALFSGFSAEARAQKQFDKMVSKLVSRNYQHEDRMLVIEQLGQMNTPAATAALFRRWDMTSDKKREDVAEKEYLSDVLESKGDTILRHVQHHNDRSVNITWPIQVLKRVVDGETVVTELLRVLSKEQARVASFKPQKKLRLIELLADYPDDPRLPGALIVSLDDFDSDVRYECARLLGEIGDPCAKDPLVDRLGHDEEDSARVRDAIVHALHKGAWKVVDRKDELGELGEGWRIGPKGNLIVAD
jgi:hypothetical protein